MSMNYHNITTADMMNGDGLRVVLWLSGCNHHCHNCQNPQTWDANSGIPYDKEADIEISAELNKDYISGITFTGGDPMFEYNLDNVYDLCGYIKKLYPNKTIWIYTGFTWEELQSTNIYRNDERRLILKYCDVLVDGRYVESLRDTNAKWRGSTNQRVIDVQKSLQSKQVILYCD